MLKFKDYFVSYKEFESKIVKPLRDVVGDVSWLDTTESSKTKYYSTKLIFMILANQYNERYPYHKESEFIGYFNNVFLTVAPMFYARVSSIVEDKLSELRDNTKVGVRTTVNSRSKDAKSTTPYNNVVGDAINVDNKEFREYNQTAHSENILENAINLSKAKISGEVDRFVGSFYKLFTVIDMRKIVKTSLTPDIIDYIEKLSKQVYNNRDAITATQPKVEHNKEAIRAIQPKVEENGESIRETQTKVKGNRADIDTLKQSVKYYKGQIMSFNEVKTNTKFTDPTLFKSHILTEGMALLGGFDGATTWGDVKRHNHIVGTKFEAAAGTVMTDGYDSGYGLSLRAATYNFDLQYVRAMTDHTGDSNFNKAWGITIIKVIYVALKDITYKEME